MTKKTQTSNTQGIDIIALLLAAFYMQSVLTVAHHTSLWVHDGVTHQTVGPPATILLVAGLVLCGYSWMKRKGAPSTIVVIALTVFATASLFWLSGLRTNFYF